MKTLVFVLFLSFCFSSSFLFGQEAPKDIIKREFQRINGDSSLTTIVLENEDFLSPLPDGGGKLTGYYKKNELVKITQWIGISYGTELIEFYFQDSNLIFVYERFDSFVYDAKTDSVRFNETERTFEGRYWFVKGKIIDYVTTGHNRFEDDQIDPGITFTAEARELKILLDRKRRMLNSR